MEKSKYIYLCDLDIIRVIRYQIPNHSTKYDPLDVQEAVLYIALSFCQRFYKRRKEVGYCQHSFHMT